MSGAQLVQALRRAAPQFILGQTGARRQRPQARGELRRGEHLGGIDMPRLAHLRWLARAHSRNCVTARTVAAQRTE